jgi:hypothetical protein
MCLILCIIQISRTLSWYWVISITKKYLIFLIINISNKSIRNSLVILSLTNRGWIFMINVKLNIFVNINTSFIIVCFNYRIINVIVSICYLFFRYIFIIMINIYFWIVVIAVTPL